MSCTILVFVKQVPDTKNVTGEAMKPDGTINRQALPAIFNPEDLNALELALQLKDRYGAKVIVATMGLPAPFGKQFFKIARVALLPFGAKVVRLHY